MATKGYRQTHWIGPDRQTVMAWIAGKKVPVWIAPDFDQASEYALAANAEFQIAEYGHVDPRATDLIRAALKFGF